MSRLALRTREPPGARVAGNALDSWQPGRSHRAGVAGLAVQTGRSSGSGGPGLTDRSRRTGLADFALGTFRALFAVTT